MISNVNKFDVGDIVTVKITDAFVYDLYSIEL